MKTVAEIVRTMEADDEAKIETQLSEYVKISMRERINMTEAYINSQFTSPKFDSLGREKFFKNIVISARNIWFRATDIDCKDIKVRATKLADEIKAFLATVKLQEWMRKSRFGRFLNDWGLTLATHGSAISKFVKKGNELICQVIDWNNIICDSIDFENNPKIEKLFFTPSKLKQKQEYNQELVKQLLDNLTSRTTSTGERKDNKDDYIQLYEIHGEFSVAQLKQSKGEEWNEEDEDEFVDQMHVITFIKSDTTGDFEDYTLYSGREARSPYRIDHLIKKEGQTYSGGAVLNLFEAQQMVNHAQKLIKDRLDAQKDLYQTSDNNFVGKNVLTDLENGDVLITGVNQGITKVNNEPDINNLQAFMNDWQSIANQINGIADAMVMQAKSGTAWRQTQAELQEAHSLFELMTENKGLGVTEMMEDFVIPFVKEQLNNSDEISGILTSNQIKQIDEWFIPNEVTRRINQKKKDTILWKGDVYDPLQEGVDATEATTTIQSDLKGNQRFISPSEIEKKTWKEVLKNLEWDLEIDVTGEVKDVQSAMTTIGTALQTFAANPGIEQNPVVRFLLDKLLTLSGGVSPLELPRGQTTQSMAPVNQQPNQLPNLTLQPA
jgi:hypothetical protein